MVTVVDVWVRQGFSRQDHLASNGPGQAIIGRSYRSVGEAHRAAIKAARPGNPNRSPVAMEVLLPNGEKMNIGTD